MTHVSFGVFRASVRDPGTTLASLANRPSFPTPYPSASSSIVRFHREGPDAAWAELDRTFRTSSYWGRSGTPQAGWADSIRECFRVYRSLAESDPRRSFAMGLNRELVLAPNDMGVYIDVIMLDQSGYVPRLALWDTNELTPARARLYAAPVWAVMDRELGAGRVAGVEVWQLRSGDRELVRPREAEAALTEVETVVHRVAGS